MKKQEVVTIRTFATLGEAQVYQALLESAGIVCMLENELASAMFPVGGGLLEVGLVVSAADEERARRVLKANFDVDEFRRETGGNGKKSEV